jgi:protein translocase SecG subunit
MLPIAEIIVACLLVVTVLMQSHQGGLSRGWGGVGAYHTKKGLEKVMSWATVGLGLLLAILALLDALT